MSITAISLRDLPAIGAPLDAGIFAGLTTQPDGTHCAVALLSEQGSDLNHKQAVDWTASVGGVLPTKPVAALLVANVKSLLRPQWHWLAESNGASYAWGCNFHDGGQLFNHKSAPRSSVAVRLIPLIP